MPDTIITPSAQSLLTCAQQQFLLNPNPPRHFQLRVGLDPVAADFTGNRDYCCEGLVYVRVIRRFPAGNNWPVRDEVSMNCSPAAWGAELELGSFRCVPATDQNSMDADAWEAAFENVQNDQEAMAEAICCWVEDQKNNNRSWMNYIVRDWFPFANQGGCSGGAISVTGQFESCC